MKCLMAIIVSLAILNSYAEKYPSHYTDWSCQGNCSDFWGQTKTGTPSVKSLVSEACGKDSQLAFVQYSRPNDDTPAGSNPTVYLSKAVGEQRSKELLQRKEDGQYVLREELLKIVNQFILSLLI